MKQINTTYTLLQRRQRVTLRRVTIMGHKQTHLVKLHVSKVILHRQRLFTDIFSWGGGTRPLSHKFSTTLQLADDNKFGLIMLVLIVRF